MSTPKAGPLLLLALAAAAGVACRPHVEARAEHNQQPASQSIPQPAVTTISIGPQVLRTNVERFGINLSGQSFYDSGQMLRNLVARNPGFEGEIWQSILRCKVVTTTSCTEENQYTQWPSGFLNGARFEILSGVATGLTGTVETSTAAAPPNGITLRFAALARPLHTGDFILVKADKPGDPTAGWWPELHNGAAFSAETRDLPPHASGRQALRVEASAPGQSAILTSYFDSLEGHSFVQLHGPYEIRFRAKPTAGFGSIAINLTRLDTVHGRSEFFNKDVHLTPGWHDYVFSFEAHEDGRAVGTVGLQFAFNGTSALLDDVSLFSSTASTTPSPPPAFRPEVVEALRALHPGLLRYMDSGAGFGSSLDNLLQPQFARQRAGYNTQNLKQEDIPIGLEDFLELCAAVNADPWITLPPGLSPTEAAALIDFLSGPATTPYGSKRAALGHVAPWSQTFHTIHLELGNEQWNSRSFAGGTIHDPTAYAARAAAVFTAMRRSSSFNQTHFDLIAGTWYAVPWWTGQELAGNPSADTLAIAPYLFAEFNDASSDEAVFGPMLAQPEQLDSRPTGLVAQQAAELHKSTHRPHLAIYEVNLGVMSGTATQAQLDRAIPSWGGGLAVADHMLLMLRDQGITTQALFCLPEFRNPFTNTAGGGNETVPLWGSVVDMGGNTNRKRPTYLALQAINSALLPTMLQTTVTGPNPTWDQPLSKNDKVELRGAHELQTFAFADGDRRSLILLNLSRTQARTVQLASSPTGTIEQTVIAPAHLTDGNEQANTVRAVTTTLPASRIRDPLTLPSGSLTVLRWRIAP